MAPKLDLIAFFEGTGADFRGRKFSDILQWPDSELEASHDYIQTLFPLPEASQVNWSATIIDSRVFDAFRSQPELREKLRAALTRMLSFYGFQWLDDAGEKRVRQNSQKTYDGPTPLSPVKTNLYSLCQVVRGDNFDTASQNWVCRFDHNHLRITRIIRSLRILGLQEEALAFFKALKLVQEASNISSRSLMYWSRAAFRPLDIAPEVDPEDEDAVRGPKFLREYEKKRHEEAVAKKEDGESTVRQIPEPVRETQPSPNPAASSEPMVEGDERESLLEDR